MATSYAIKASNICIEFNKVKILKNVDFHLTEGEVHAVAGSNGAGKSTLMKILNGVYRRNSGEISMFGKPVDFVSPEIARREGLAMVFQDLSLIPTLTVAENIFLRSIPFRKGILIDDKACNEKAREMLQMVGVGADTSPTERVENISVGQRQIIEILKALSEDPKVLILDEPTASLTYSEIENLFAIIRKLKDQGISIIYITHYLQDIFKICDSVTVLRDGANALSEKTENITLDDVVDSMIGSASANVNWNRKKDLRSGTPLLDVQQLSTAHVHDISMKVYRGEVVGIAGLLGSGRSELLDALFGIDRSSSGKINIDSIEKKITSTKQAIEAGITLVPENRREQGLTLDFTVSENIVMSVIHKLKQRLLIDRRKEKSLVHDFISSLNIKTQGPGQLVRFLSGGNQQKIVVAKCLATDSKILLLDDPTFGVDIHAKQEIMKIIRKFVDKGNGAIFISSEFKEIAEFCDAIYVMKKGTLSQFVSENVGEDELMRIAQ